jgi:hypothetical protein
MRHGGGGALEMVVKVEMVVVAKGKLLKSRLPRRSEKRKALDAKSAGTQHRHPRGESPPHLVTPEASYLAITSTPGTGPKTFYSQEGWRLTSFSDPSTSSNSSRGTEGASDIFSGASICAYFLPGTLVRVGMCANLQ